MSEGDGSAYEIGYGRPPRWSRFRKGTSGNPRGRPRKTGMPQEALPHSNSDAALRRELDRKINVTEGGRVSTISMLEAVIKAQAVTGAKGNALAQRDLLRSARELERREAEEARMQARLAQEAAVEEESRRRRMFDYMVRFKAERTAVWEEALAQGKSEPDCPWPHPEDILLYSSRKRYYVRGPCDGDDLQFAHRCRAERDLYFARMNLAYRSSSKFQQALGKAWSLIWVWYDVRLPKRWQVLDRATELMDYYHCLPLRALRRQVEEFERVIEGYRLVNPEAYASKEGYRVANEALKPWLRKLGYRSLAQFERAQLVETGGGSR